MFTKVKNSLIDSEIAKLSSIIQLNRCSFLLFCPQQINMPLCLFTSWIDAKFVGARGFISPFFLPVKYCQVHFVCVMFLCAHVTYLWQINDWSWNSASVICVLLWSGARLETEIARLLYISTLIFLWSLGKILKPNMSWAMRPQSSIASSVCWKNNKCSVFAFV